MRHKNVSTTLKIYTQVRTEEVEASLPGIPRARVTGPKDPTSNVIQMKWRA